jgi:hypothetical protein
MQKIYSARDCLFSVGERIVVIEDYGHAFGGDAGKVVFIPQTPRPMALIVNLDRGIQVVVPEDRVAAEADLQ